MATARKVDLPSILIVNITKNIEVLLMIGKLPKSVICSNFWPKNKQKS